MKHSLPLRIRIREAFDNGNCGCNACTNQAIMRIYNMGLQRGKQLATAKLLQSSKNKRNVS